MRGVNGIKGALRTEDDVLNHSIKSKVARNQAVACCLRRRAPAAKIKQHVSEFCDRLGLPLFQLSNRTRKLEDGALIAVARLYVNLGIIRRLGRTKLVGSRARFLPLPPRRRIVAQCHIDETGQVVDRPCLRYRGDGKRWGTLHHVSPRDRGGW